MDGNCEDIYSYSLVVEVDEEKSDLKPILS